MTAFRWRSPLADGATIEWLGGYCEPGEVVTLWHAGVGEGVRVEEVRGGWVRGIVAETSREATDERR